MSQKVKFVLKRAGADGYEEPVKKYYPHQLPRPPQELLIPETGMSKKATQHDIMREFESFKPLEHYHDIFRLCVKCGTCRYIFRQWDNVCPSGNLRGFESYYLGGKNALLWGLTRGYLVITDSLKEVFYHCTLCGNCQVQCQLPEVRHYAMDYLESFREKLVKEGLGPLSRHKEYIDHTAKEYNPYIELHKDRWNWLPIPVDKLPKKADIVYFVGCTSSYRQQNIAKATFEILQKSGVKFTIVKDERCCGSPLQRVGEREISTKLAEHNIREIEKTGASQVITSCAGCYRQIKKDWKRRYGLDYDFEILHSSVFLLDLIKKGKIKPTKEMKKRITYHDPCHLGRHTGIYDEPRELLKTIPGIELVEMSRYGQFAWCCGSGSGVRAQFPELVFHASRERLNEAKETGAEALVSVCPFCYRAFKDTIEKYKIDIELYDATELLLSAL